MASDNSSKFPNATPLTMETLMGLPGNLDFPIVSTIRRYKEIVHPFHEFVLTGVTNLSNDNSYWIRAERSVDQSSVFATVFIPFQRPPAKEIFFKANGPLDLINSNRDIQIINTLSFEQEGLKPPLLQYCRLIRLINRVSPNYRLRAEQCYWFCDVIMRIMESTFNGEVEQGSAWDKRGTYRGFSDILNHDKTAAILREFQNLDADHLTTPATVPEVDIRSDEKLPYIYGTGTDQADIAQCYSELLYPHGSGLPIWNPGPFDIGDMGYFEDGYFVNLEKNILHRTSGPFYCSTAKPAGGSRLVRYPIPRGILCSGTIDRISLEIHNHTGEICDRTLSVECKRVPSGRSLALLSMEPVPLTLLPSERCKPWNQDPHRDIDVLNNPKRLEDHLRSCIKHGLLTEYLFNNKALFFPWRTEAVSSWAAAVLEPGATSATLTVIQTKDSIPGIRWEGELLRNKATTSDSVIDKPAMAEKSKRPYVIFSKGFYVFQRQEDPRSAHITAEGIPIDSDADPGMTPDASSSATYNQAKEPSGSSQHRHRSKSQLAMGYGPLVAVADYIFQENGGVRVFLVSDFDLDVMLEIIPPTTMLVDYCVITRECLASNHLTIEKSSDGVANLQFHGRFHDLKQRLVDPQNDAQSSEEKMVALISSEQLDQVESLREIEALLDKSTFAVRSLVNANGISSLTALLQYENEELVAAAASILGTVVEHAPSWQTGIRIVQSGTLKALGSLLFSASESTRVIVATTLRKVFRSVGHLLTTHPEATYLLAEQLIRLMMETPGQGPSSFANALWAIADLPLVDRSHPIDQTLSDSGSMASSPRLSAFSNTLLSGAKSSVKTLGELADLVPVPHVKATTGTAVKSFKRINMFKVDHVRQGGHNIGIRDSSITVLGILASIKAAILMFLWTIKDDQGNKKTIIEVANDVASSGFILDAVGSVIPSLVEPGLRHKERYRECLSIVMMMFVEVGFVSCIASIALAIWATNESVWSAVIGYLAISGAAVYIYL